MRSLQPLEAAAGNDADVFLRHEAATALRSLKDRLGAGSPVDALIASLRSGDRQREDEALRRLATLDPDEARRADVSRALEGFLTGDVFRMEAVSRAAARWADDRARGKLIELMTEPGFRAWGHVVKALSAAGPDDITLRAIVARYKDDRHVVGDALKTLGPRAEGPLLVLISDGSQPFDARAGALHLLAEIGTPKSFPLLRAMAAHAGDEPVAAAAEDAIKAIQSRY